MKTNNFWFRKIAEKVTSKSYGDYLANKFFLKEILKAYDVVVDRPLSFNRLLRDWYEAVTGVVVDGVFTDHYYLKRLADFLAGYDVGLKTGNFYLGLIAELIDSKEDSSVSLSVGSVSPFVGDVVVLSGVLEPKGGVVKLYDGDSLLDTLETSSSDGSFSKSWTATIGTHSFKAVFEETEEYKGSESETVVVNVVKKTTVTSLSVNSASVYVDDTISLEGSVLWGVNPVEGVSVKLYDGDTLVDTLTTDSDGEFGKSITAVEGAHSYKAVFEGGEVYEGSQSSFVNVSVVKKVTSLSLSAVDSSLFVDDDLVLEGALLWNNTGVSGASVKLYQDDVLLDTLTTGNDGSFSKTVSGLADGDYVYNVVYDGTNVYESSQSQDVNVEVSKYNTSLSLNVPMNLVYSDSFNLSGVLTDENNNVLKNMSVKLLVDNVEKATTTTDNTGTASFTQTPVRTGNHDFQLTYAGNYKYEACNSSVVSRVVDKETSVLSVTTPATSSTNYYSDDTITIGGSLVDNDSTPQPIKSATILIKEGNTTLKTLTTGNDGGFTTTLDLNVGEHSLSIVYAGDENYTSSSVSRTITVSKHTTIMSISVPSTSSSNYYTDDTKTLTGTLLYDSNKALVGKSVLVKEGNSTIKTLTTGVGGAFTGALDLSLGAHNLSIVFNEDTDYLGSNVSRTINIIKHTPAFSNVSYNKVSLYVSETLTVTGKLLDESNNPVKNVSVKLMNGDTLIKSALTGNDGGFTISDSTLSADTYSMKLSFEGNGDYESAVTGNTSVVVVKKTPVVVISGSESEIYTNETVTISGTVKYDNTGVNNISVKIYDGNTLLDTVSTNASGEYSKTVSGLAKGTHTFKAVSVENNEYESVTSSNVSVEVFNVIAGISIESDKSIISGYHSEVCTLTAKLLDSDGAVVTKDNLNITFKKNGTAIGSAVATTDGVATKTFTASNGGELELKAEYSSFNDTCTVEDIYYYTDGKTDLNNWETISGVQITYTSKGLKATSNVDTINRPKLNITLPDYYSVEAKVTEHYINSGTTGLEVEGATLLGIPDYVQSTFEGGTSQEAVKVSPALANGDVLKLVYSGGNVSSYRNNVFIVGRIADSVYDGVRFRTYNRRSITLTDFKIKRLDLGSVLLASDKSILSYADGETCTLSATVKDSNGDAITVAGIGVQFYNGATLLGTSYTNANGVATYTYTSTGVGDIVLSAKTGNNITSNSINIEDTTFYDPATTDQKSKYTLNNAQTITYDSEAQAYQLVSSKIWGYTSVPINLSKPFILEADLKIISTGSTNRQPRLIFNLANDDWIGVRLCSIGGSSDDIQGHLFKNNNHTFGDDKIRYTAIQGDWYHMESIWDGVTLTNRVLKDGVLIGSIHTNNFTGETGERGIGVCCGLHTTSCQFKGLKLKPLTVDSISLASDKSILSYEDSETCTLTATVSKSYGSIANIPVQFYNGNVWLGTGVTDSNGVATYSYASTGVGDVTITAKIGSITSNEITIEDCTYYTTGATDENKWNNTQYVTMTYDATDGITAKGNTTQVGKGILDITYPSAPFSAEFTVPNYVTDGNASSRVSLYGVAFAKNTNDSKVELGTHNSISAYTISFPKGSTVKMVYNGTSVEVFINGVSAGSWNVITDWDGLCVRTYNTRSISIKNLKIKPQ